MNEGMKINDKVINEAARIGNLYLVKYFLQTYQIPKNILVFSTEIGNIELVKYILEQGININAKNIVCYNDIMFQNDIWKIFKLFETALIWASYNGHTEIVKLLLEQEEIDINAKNIYLFYFGFILIISYFKIIFGNYIKYFIQLLGMHLNMATQK